MERCKLGAFITNLGKFNEGETIGEWINFPIKQEEFQKVLDRIGMVIGLVICGTSKNSDEKEAHVPGEPDVVSSMKMNNDENLMVVANRDEIKDKVEFAKLLVKMCQENSFRTIKFSTDFGYATKLNMRVYLWRDEIEGNNPIMQVEFKPVEWNQNYDIVNNPDMFELYVDGKLVEYE